MTPLSWLKLSGGSEFDNFADAYSFSSVRSGGSFRPTAGRVDTRSSYWLWQSVGANVEVYDSGPGDNRYFAHIFGGVATVPGQSDVVARWRVGVGAEAGARWALSQNLAVNARAVLGFDHVTYLNADAVYPSARVLLSNDALGVAIGPVYDGAVLTGRVGGVTADPTTAFVGAEALAQPFAKAESAVLRGLIVDATGEHSIGQADVFPAGRSSGTRYSAKVSLHFQY